jgi:hypothetical protein
VVYAKFSAYHGLVTHSCEVLYPFILQNIHPNILHKGATNESEFRRCLLHKKICSKSLGCTKHHKD